MRKLWSITGLVLVLCLWIGPLAQAQEEEPLVRGYLFYSQNCPDCRRVRTEVMPQLYRQFGQTLQIKAVDIQADEANYEWMLACAAKYGVSEGELDTPVVFIGDEYLIGHTAIEAELPSLVENHFEHGGLDFPDVPRPGEPLEPTVQFMFFFSPSCPHCRDVEENVFPAIEEKYGDQVQWFSYDRSEEQSYRALLMLGQAAGLPEDRRGAVPMVFIGDETTVYALLLGGYEIGANLEPAIDWFMTVGGVGLPEWTEELFNVAATPFPQNTPDAETPSPEASTPSPEANTPSPVASETPVPEGQAIHMAYFEELGCSECDRVTAALEHLQNRFPTLVVHKFDVIDHLAINLCLSERLDVPEDQRHDAPAIFVGEDFLVDTDIQYETLIQIVSKYVETGAEPTWETCTSEVELPPPPPWWAVIVPGLADGINPCAFATIIFFVSYLSIIRRKGRDIIMVGLAFTLAVFLSYLGFGMLLREIFAGLIDLVGPVLRPILNALTALLCLVLAILSFVDFRKARQGNVKDMALQLPHKLRTWINTSIRKSMRSETLVTASFVSGVCVSFIELACTGQVYVPIIQGLSNPQYRAQSTLALIIYCLAFVVPLIVVFILSYMGTSSKQLTRFFDRYAAPVKLVMALLFLGIGFWLIYDILRVWGVMTPLLV